MPQPPDARLHDAEVVSNEAVAQDVFRIVLRAPALAGALRPGRFVEVSVPGDPTQIVRIPVSYSGAFLDEGLVETAYALVGDGTRRMSRLVPGAVLSVLGPCGGRGWSFSEGQGRSLLVAGGIGITPLVGLARALGALGIPYDAVVGAQTASRLWGLDELTQAGAGQVIVTTDDGTAGVRGFTTSVAQDLLGDGGYESLYTCGPEVMMRRVASIARNAEVPCQVSMERMMTCGFGACNTCNVAMAAGGYAGACTAGPVFDAGEVAW